LQESHRSAEPTELKSRHRTFLIELFFGSGHLVGVRPIANRLTTQ
jgi:hypothetical protein